MKPKLTSIGWGLLCTVLWLVGAGLTTGIAYHYGKVQVPDKLNEWGDFFAGLFAPLAFFWLVLGYKQQGDELKDQAKELQRSVDAQRAMARAMQDQLQHQRLAYADAHHPKLLISLGQIEPLDTEREIYRFDIANDGAPAFKVNLFCKRRSGEQAFDQIGHAAAEELPRFSTVQVQMRVPAGLTTLYLDALYQDGNGATHAYRMRCDRERHAFGEVYCYSEHEHGRIW